MFFPPLFCTSGRYDDDDDESRYINLQPSFSSTQVHSLAEKYAAQRQFLLVFRAIQWHKFGNEQEPKNRSVLHNNGVFLKARVNGDETRCSLALIPRQSQDTLGVPGKKVSR
jgi:hypothetical protein